MATRIGAFALGFATGALTVVGIQRLREYAESEDYERLADTVQENLQALEARIAGTRNEEAPAPKRAKAKKSA